MLAVSPVKWHIRLPIEWPAASAAKPISRRALRFRYSDRTFPKTSTKGKVANPSLPHSGPNACLTVAQAKPIRLLGFRAESRCAPGWGAGTGVVDQPCGFVLLPLPFMAPAGTAPCRHWLG